MTACAVFAMIQWGLSGLTVLRFFHRSPIRDHTCWMASFGVIRSPLQVSRRLCSYASAHSENKEHKGLFLLENEKQRLHFDGLVEGGVTKMRLDQWLTSQLPRVSRVRVQSSIRLGKIVVNGQPISKMSHTVKAGDYVLCTLVSPVPMEAQPEDICLDVVFEDEYLLVINKPAHVVVHPAPGHSTGTLVNALLHHCGVPAIQKDRWSQKGLLSQQEEKLSNDPEKEFLDDDEHIIVPEDDFCWHGPAPVIRPGIVHRLDKGTSGLLVVAKDDYTHDHLCKQFHARTVQRSYLSLTCGVPPLPAARVDAPIGRDPRDRKRMAVISSSSSNSQARSAASRYRVLEVLAQGGSALVEWKLETGRTHQIRVHAQHMGFPLLGDDVYGGTPGAAVARMLPHLPASKHVSAQQLVTQIERPCLHAVTLGFMHPWTNVQQTFIRGPPEDFEEILQGLREF